nr:copper chaperone PCu(A)C [Bacteriovorax sp. HI3]
MKMLILLFSLLSFEAFGASKIQIKDVYIRATPPGASTTAAFASITNSLNQDVELVSVEGDFAKTFELHDMDMSGGVMKMRKVSSIVIKKDGIVELKSGGLHVMIFDLKSTLNKTQKYKLKFNFSNKESLVVSASVK